MKHYLLRVIYFLLLCSPIFCQAQTDSTNWLQVRAANLLKTDSISDTYVEIASRKSQVLEEAPSIVSVISKEDIATYGARDLSDVLRMIPGFDLAVDVEGLFSFGFRGAWAHEGKALLMINGVGVMELAFGNMNMIGTYPCSMIERVEIIRGPGSVLYGGFAEVAVINIITHKARNLKGLRLSANAGLVGKDELSANTNISAGLKNENVEIAIHAGIGTNPQSTRNYNAYEGTIPTTTLNNKNAFRQFQHCIVDAKFKNLTLKYNLTSFNFSAQQSDIIHPQINGQYGEKRNNTVHSVHLDYATKITENIKLMPTIEYTKSNLILTTVNPSLSVLGTFQNPTVLMDKWRAEISGTFKDNLLTGIGTITDNISALSDIGLPGLKLSNNPADTAQFKSIYSYYAYSQYAFKVSNFSFTMGIRYEATSFGNAFLPRLSAVYYNNKFNAKLLFSRSFRIPMLYQSYTRDLGDGNRAALKPELTSTLELELGYKLGKNTTIKGNLFYLNLDEPIVFLGEYYTNYGSLNSAGAELELAANLPKYGGFVNFSFTSPVGDTSADFLTDNKNTFLGFAPLKINLGAYYKIKDLSLAPRLSYLSPRAAATKDFAQGNTQGEFQSETYQANLLLDFTINYRNLFKNMDIAFSIYNALNDDFRLLQPYYGTHAPMPVYDRQFVMSVVWRY